MASAPARRRSADVRSLPTAAPRAVSSSVPSIAVARLKKRSEFLRVAQGGRKRVTATLVMQAMARDPGEASARVGFTTSKKLGNAVARNRIRRRLKAACAQVLPQRAQPGCDYVVIGRPAAREAEFTAILRDLGYALRDLRFSEETK